MKNLQGVWVVSLLALALTGLARADGITLYTFPAPPFQVVSEQPSAGPDVRGLTVDTVLCATAAAGMQGRIRSAPQRRAIQFLLNSLTDGYFAVDASDSMDHIAFRTDPVSLEKWYLVSHADPYPLGEPRIGAIIGSNEEAWWRSQGQEIFLTVRTAEQLIALLQRRRIDQVLMDQRVLESLTGTDELSRQFLRYVPLHMYFSRDFVSRNPEFIQAFNRQIPACIDGGFDLDRSETRQIRATAYDLLEELEKRVPLAAAIEKGPSTRSLSEILNLDAQWRAMAPLHYSAMARRIAAQEASIAMGKWQKEHASLVTEVMLTNSIGALVAMSQLTSDFWQGDEPQFEHHIRRDISNLYVSPIYYDASTARFQVKVSMPITVEGQWLPAGVVMIGLDVEQALTGNDRSTYLTEVID